MFKLYQDQSYRGYTRTELSPANYRDWKAMSTSFQSMAAYHTISVNLVGQGEPERLDGASVEADFFPTLGIHPLIGRIFTPEDDRHGAPGTLILSYGLWQARFGGDLAVVGRKVTLDEEPFVVVGVMPKGFHFPSRQVELWTPTRFAPERFEDRTDTHLYAIARLSDGVSIDVARAQLRLVAAQLERQYPKENARTSATVIRLRDEISWQSQLLLLALVGASMGVLLIACMNLANLLLARGLVRRREVAVRTALGAGRERLIRQLLTESLIVAGAGGLLGILLALVSFPLVARLVPATLPLSDTPGVNSADACLRGCAHRGHRSRVRCRAGTPGRRCPGRWRHARGESIRHEPANRAAAIAAGHRRSDCVNRAARDIGAADSRAVARAEHRSRLPGRGRPHLEDDAGHAQVRGDRTARPLLSRGADRYPAVARRVQCGLYQLSPYGDARRDLARDPGRPAGKSGRASRRQRSVHHQ